MSYGHEGPKRGEMQPGAGVRDISGVPGKQTLTETLPVMPRAPVDASYEEEGVNGEPEALDMERTPISQDVLQNNGSPTSEIGPGSEINAANPTNAPAATYIIPFDRSPKSLPGERIIFGAVFTDPRPNDYQLVFKGTGGDFDSAGSGTKTVTSPGIVKNNLNFIIDARWDKKTSVTVKLELQKKADRSVVQAETWTFGAKTTVPTTVTQAEPATERALPGVYSYKCGPDLKSDGNDDYIGQTILEEFSANKSNLTVADVKPEYARANGLTTDQLVTNHFFGSDAGNNGTFTVSVGDMFYDQHGGGMPDKATFESALVAMKEIYVDLPQVYSAEPGKPLGKYTVRRILKTDGSKKIKKWKTV